MPSPNSFYFGLDLKDKFLNRHTQIQNFEICQNLSILHSPKYNKFEVKKIHARVSRHYLHMWFFRDFWKTNVRISKFSQVIFEKWKFIFLSFQKTRKKSHVYVVSGHTRVNFFDFKFVVFWVVQNRQILTDFKILNVGMSIQKFVF